MSKKGWYREPARHSLAARGVKFPRKSWYVHATKASRRNPVSAFVEEVALMNTKKMVIFPNPQANKLAEDVKNWFEYDRPDIELSLKNQASMDNLVIVPFLNGRERGYTAVYGKKSVSWAEDRISNQLMVYPFDWFGGNLDENYKMKTKNFRKDDGEAYKYILKYLGIDM
jgi:hypothetical protein